ncbi:polysaccharide biosynthesis protein [Paenibacillus ginsengihumi]|uniref:polysaccharide biosynthesis protein n=1 Tax=Paenibacillus ginsengihumi TaxID=431596 RepID=UPI00036D0C20|nr:nucleoside-diphosphate sugar epimerase/dehydratase [Paenibacillus ginsengihumi]
MSSKQRTAILVAIDVLIVWISIYSSYLLRFGGNVPPLYYKQCMIYGLCSIAVCLLTAGYFKLYQRVWQYASIGELVAILAAVFITCLAATAVAGLLTGRSVPLSIVLRAYETILLLMGGVRFVWRVYRDRMYRIPTNKRKALIIGAGDCGTMIAKELKYNKGAQMYPVAFIDDDKTKHRKQIMGITVVGGREMVPQIVKEKGIHDIIIAMPSLSRKDIAGVIDICKSTGAKLKLIPKLGDLIDGKIAVKEIRDVDVEDLLGRDPIKVDLEGIANYVENKTVLVTGAGGSIGSELCRQVLPFRPSRLLLLGHGENSIYAIEMELRRTFPGAVLETIIADVQDRERMDDVFKTYRPDVVFHAAAHKHVPLMERNPAEAVKNNVFGTKNVADCADKYGTERFVMISTDKAVNPTSVMGTTKRIAEMYVQALNNQSETKFAAVRFGNVLGSRGSVIPHFKQQIAMGGPVTVTHPEMIRYFMTIPEAVQLVIQAGAFAEGGEVFVLDMGEPVKIVDLATDLIRLSGFEPNVDIQIQFTGMRPGEKLYEELLTSEEGLGSTKHNRIFIGHPVIMDRTELDFEMKKLEKVLTQGQEPIRALLKHIVPTFQSSNKQDQKELVTV